MKDLQLSEFPDPMLELESTNEVTQLPAPDGWKPDLVPGTPLTHSRVIDLDGSPIKVFTDESFRVAIPDMWASETYTSAFWDTACRLLADAHPALLSTPWLIGSTDQDITGAPRKSEDHLSLRAFDMSPMYSETQALPVTKQAAGLAWNMLSAFSLATLPLNEISAVIEGDHLHISLDGKPSVISRGQALAVWTLSSWYPLRTIVSDLIPMDKLMNRPFLVDARKLTMSAPSHELALLLRTYVKGDNV